MTFTWLVEALAAEGTFELYGDGSQSRSFTYIDDAAAATVAAMGARLAERSTPSAAAQRRRSTR
jgi:nucleoside-diphosphate-sugar epimerase